MWLVEGATNERAIPFQACLFLGCTKAQSGLQTTSSLGDSFPPSVPLYTIIFFLQPIIFSTNENCVIFYKCDHVGRFPDLQTQILKTFILFSFKILTNSLVLGLRCYVNIVCNGASQQYIYIIYILFCCCTLCRPESVVRIFVPIFQWDIFLGLNYLDKSMTDVKLEKQLFYIYFPVIRSAYQTFLYIRCLKV